MLAKDWAPVIEGFEKIINSDKAATDVVAENNLKEKVDSLKD